MINVIARRRVSEGRQPVVKKTSRNPCYRAYLCIPCCDTLAPATLFTFLTRVTLGTTSFIVFCIISQIDRKGTRLTRKILKSRCINHFHYLLSFYHFEFCHFRRYDKNRSRLISLVTLITTATSGE